MRLQKGFHVIVVISKYKGEAAFSFLRIITTYLVLISRSTTEFEECYVLCCKSKFFITSTEFDKNISD